MLAQARGTGDRGGAYLEKRKTHNKRQLAERRELSRQDGHCIVYIEHSQKLEIDLKGKASHTEEHSHKEPLDLDPLVPELLDRQDCGVVSCPMP